MYFVKAIPQNKNSQLSVPLLIDVVRYHYQAMLLHHLNILTDLIAWLVSSNVMYINELRIIKYFFFLTQTTSIQRDLRTVPDVIRTCGM